MKLTKNGKKIGRPSKMTPETIAKLEEAYKLHATDEQAAFNAGITVQTIYDYQKKHPEFVLRKNALKGNLAYQAKISLAKHLKHDGDLALKTLERIEKDTFALKTPDNNYTQNNITFSFITEEEAQRLADKDKDIIDAHIAD